MLVTAWNAKALAAVLLLTVSCAATNCALPRRIPDTWVIPDGYEGWVKIDYIVKHAPALPIEKGYRIIRLSSAGYAQTPSELLDGWASDNFQYDNGSPLHQTGWGEGGSVWGGVAEAEIVRTEVSKTAGTCRSTGRFTSQCYFIGTEAKYRAAGACASPRWPSVPASDRIPVPQ